MTKGHRTAKPRFWVLLTLALLAAFACAYGNEAYYLRMQNDKLQELEKQQRTLEDQKLELERELEYRDTDEYIIREAREKLNMLMPGELIFQSADY